MILTIFVLLFLYQLKHYFADYPLQGAYMLRKFADGTAWILPLTAHAAVHMAFTFAICVLFSHKPWLALWCSLFDFVVHFVMDRIKASPKMLGRYKYFSGKEYLAFPMVISFDRDNGNSPYLRKASEEEMVTIRKSNTFSWWCLGVDQMVHHLTHYAIIFVLVINQYGLPNN